MRFVLVLAFALLAAPALAHHTPYLDDTAAINKAGRQRMLSQYLVKEYLQTALGVDAAAARGHLMEAIGVFDDQLADLKAFSTTPDLAATFAVVEMEWSMLRPLASSPPSRERAAALNAGAERLLDAADRHTTALERHAGREVAQVVNLAGRQRMLSQRIAKDFLLVAAGVEPAAAAEDLKRAAASFEVALATLRALPGNDDDIRRELDAVAAAYGELQPLLSRARPLPAERARVVALADAILARMERVTGLYARLPTGETRQ